MSNDVVVKLESVSKFYKLYHSPKDRLKEALNPFGKKYHKEFFALKDISFELRKGECLGVIGKNGMGKSTLLKLVAHIIEPSSGSISVNGSVSALLELGTGFNPEFTGLQNIYFYGTILGFNKKQIEKKIEEIIKFADIGEFIDQPVKTYSSGMFVRLAFGVQTSLKPDILIVDEVLSVGDIFFQQKCHARIEELLSLGASLILVSHDMQLIEKYSTKTMLLNFGECIELGLPNQVVHSYYHLGNSSSANMDKVVYHEFNNLSYNKNPSTQEIDWPANSEFIISSPYSVKGGINIAVCKGISLCNKDRKACNVFRIGETAYLYYEVELLENIGFPYGMATIINSKNIIIHAKDTLQYGFDEITAYPVKPGTKLKFLQTFQLELAEGEYIFAVGFGQIDPKDIHDVKKADHNKRILYMKSIFGITHACKFSVIADENNLIFPFHGYVDLSGNFFLKTE